MLSDRVRYHAPVRQNIENEDLERPRLLTLFDDRKADLVMRIKRIRTGHAHSEQPATRVRRVVSNVCVLSCDHEIAQVESSFLMTVSRWERPATDVLRWSGGPLGPRRRRVETRRTPDRVRPEHHPKRQLPGITSSA